MKKIIHLMLVMLSLTFVFYGCKAKPPSVESQAAPLSPSSTPTHMATSIPTLTLLPEPQAKNIIVISAEDNGPGTLRQALEDAKAGDTISFDPAIFPPDNPVTILITKSLPDLNQGNLTIDASYAGVILDGKNMAEDDDQDGITIVSSGNTIRGLQIVGFPGSGIALRNGAQNNVIGGDRSIGTAPLGQGNLISGNRNFGIGLWDENTSQNIIQGNYIGITIDGKSAWGHSRDGIHSNGATQNLMLDNIIGGNEAAGVYLCCVAEGGNTITNNLIGIGPDGINLGNQMAGILLDRTSQNVVGPGNVIVNNNGGGISLWEETPTNTITQNSIRDNNGKGIEAPDNQTVCQPPLLINWNLQAGTLSGLTCANCIVEIFSDSGDEGAIYEGYAEVDAHGAFFFTKGTSLAGPFLSASATCPDGSTSEFSPPTQTSLQSLSLQEGNMLPIYLLKTSPSGELADNRIGGTAEARHISDWVWYTGLKWMRVILDPSGQWQQVNWETEEYYINQEEERIIDDLVSHGVKIMLVLDVWNLDHRVVYYKSEEDIKLYLNWVRFMVRHFKGRIEYYEILNEPDLSYENPSGMPVDAYVYLVEQTVPVIRQEDANAKIVVGAIPDTRFDAARNWMWGILNSGIIPIVDGISWHGMYGGAPADDLRGIRDPGSPQMTNYWENYPALVKEIQQVAASNGFEGEFLVEEMLWRTPFQPHESEPDGFTDISGAKYYARSIIIHLGLNVAPGLAVVLDDDRPRSYSVIQALSTIMAGAQVIDLPIHIESAAPNIKYYVFSMANGDTLAAIWTDGAAIEDDPGLPATLTISSFSVQQVIGMDILSGFEQELRFETDNGSLVVPNLLVRDYPIILRLTP